MPNEIDQMTEQELLERVWIATYAAAYMDALHSGIDKWVRAPCAWTVAGHAVEELLYTTWCEEGSMTEVSSHFKKVIRRCREGALRQFYGNQLSEIAADLPREDSK